jgi:hypothetical protein
MRDFAAGQKRIGIAGPDLGYYVMRRSALSASPKH